MKTPMSIMENLRQTTTDISDGLEDLMQKALLYENDHDPTGSDSLVVGILDLYNEMETFCRTLKTKLEFNKKLTEECKNAVKDIAVVETGLKNSDVTETENELLSENSNSKDSLEYFAPEDCLRLPFPKLTKIS